MLAVSKRPIRNRLVTTTVMAIVKMVQIIMNR